MLVVVVVVVVVVLVVYVLESEIRTSHFEVDSAMRSKEKDSLLAE